ISDGMRRMTPVGDRLPPAAERARTPTPIDRFESMGGDIDGPAVHGPGHVAGADLYTGPAAYDDRHMDPAFQTSGRDMPPPTAEAEEAPLMTTSGAPVAQRGSPPGAGRAPMA